MNDLVSAVYHVYTLHTICSSDSHTSRRDYQSVSYMQCTTVERILVTVREGHLHEIVRIDNL
jgi:hypothetical protein